jgi:ATP synthase protein I
MKQHSERSPEALPERAPHAAGIDQGMRVLSYLVAGVLLYGALGWLGDHLLGTAFLLPIGIVLGAAGGVYVIIRRYGSEFHPEAPAPRAPAADRQQKVGER